MRIGRSFSVTSATFRMKNEDPEKKNMGKNTLEISY